MDYRELYEEQTGLELKTDIHIHHIDGDRDNNKIINLVALPAKLHQRYHMYCNMLPDEVEINKELPNTLNGYIPPVLDVDIDIINSLIEAKKEIYKFINLRDVLLGYLYAPDLNKIESYQEYFEITGKDYE